MTGRQLAKHGLSGTPRPGLEYTQVIWTNNIQKDIISEYESEINKWCENCRQLFKLNETEPWDEDIPKIVFPKRKNKKSRNADGFANELFK